MTTFKLHATCSVQGEGRTEDAYTYVSEDGKRGIQFRFHSRRHFCALQLRNQDVSMQEAACLVDAFITAGMNQHSFKGGFDEAISCLSI